MAEQNDVEFKTYQEWRTDLLSTYINEDTQMGNRTWFAVGDWLINAKENTTFTDHAMAYHVCRDNYIRMHHKSGSAKDRRCRDRHPSVAAIEEGCLVCGEAIPDGIKMVAMLEQL